MSYDLVMLAVLAVCVVYGAMKGMAWQVASLCSLVLSYFVALAFSDRLAPHIGLEPPLNRFAAMLALYVACSLLVWLAFRAVAKFIDRVKLKEFDKQMGALFGAVKGVLFCMVITFFGLMLSESARESILQSHSGHYIATIIDHVDPVLPEEVHDVLGPYLHKLDEQLDPEHAVGHAPHHNRSARRPARDEAADERDW